MKKFIGLFAILATWALPAQNRLQIDVEGVEASEGEIQVALYTHEKGFLSMEGVFRADSVKATKGTTRISMDDLPTGTYALAIFHDRNSNKRLDTNWIGVPREPLGFSNARMRTFGPPTFEDCMMHLREDAHITIRLE